MSVVRKTREVFYSPRRGRHFFTAKAAALAEANARVKGWSPSEKSEYDDSGRCTFPGYHFTENARLVAIRDRLYARYLKALRG